MVAVSAQQTSADMPRKAAASPHRHTTLLEPGRRRVAQRMGRHLAGQACQSAHMQHRTGITGLHHVVECSVCEVLPVGCGNARPASSEPRASLSVYEIAASSLLYWP
jgi:hypothetical protein